VTRRHRPPEEDPAFLRNATHGRPADRKARDTEFLRAQLLGEARDCWAVFFAATHDSHAPIPWHFADAAQEFERQADAVMP